MKTPSPHQPLVDLFNDEFKISDHTFMAESPDEPMYLPADATHPHNRILYTKDSHTSVLHEIAHWCIAGESRRRQIDYGYWYKPEAQTIEEQDLYLKSESKTQGLEWIFCVAADMPFHIIPNDLSGNFQISEKLRSGIHSATLNYLRHGLPTRAERYLQKLLRFYKREALFREQGEELFEF